MAYRGKRKRRPVVAVVVILLALAAAAASLHLRPRRDAVREPSREEAPLHAVETEAPVSPPTPLITPPEPEVKPYDFTSPAPESDEAPADYFADAVFVGDSRTDGFMRYSGVQGADGIHYTGLTVFGVNDKKLINTPKGKKSVLEALADKQYGKVYLALGVNELGYKNDGKFYSAYLALIDAVRAAQPDAVIYVQNLIPLNESQVKKNYLRNDHLKTYNSLMAKAAAEKRVVYLNLFSAFAGADGQLPKDASNDGVHMKRAYCEKWLAYLRTHVVTKEDLSVEEETTDEKKDNSVRPAGRLAPVERLRVPR